jgi:hypothetical protein
MDRDEAVRHARMEMAKREGLSEIIRTKPLHLPDNSSTPTEHEDDERI